jgi:HEAT repeat protein
VEPKPGAMTTQLLLAELESLSHDARQRRMVELGRDSLATSEAGHILERFGRGGYYLRSLALVALHGSRDGERVLRFLGDPSRRLRHTALKLVVQLCSDDQVRRALPLLHPKEQRVLLLGLRRQRRQALLDELLSRLAESDAGTLRGVFGLASRELATNLAEQSLRNARPNDWRRLARTHPDLASTLLQHRAASSGAEDGMLRSWANAALREWGQRQHTAPALPLLQALLEKGHAWGSLVWQPCYSQSPEATVDLLLRHESALSAVLQPLPGLRDDQFVELLQRNWFLPVHRWLRSQSPGRRQIAYATAGELWRDARGFIPYEQLRHLDEATRATEVARIYSSSEHFVPPGERLRLAGLLPWDAALAEITPGLGDPEPTVRSQALSALVSAGRFSPDKLADILVILQQRKNEPDPVRYAWLEALALLPPSRWKPGHFKGLAQLIRDALDAADLSVASNAALQKFLGRLLVHRPLWAAPWLAKVVAHLGYLNPAAVSAGLPEPALRAAGEELLPVLQAWQPRERFEQLVSLVRLLGTRSAVVPGLLDIVEGITRDPRGSDAGPAAQALAQSSPARFRALVPQLLALDPSWILHASVCAHVHRHEQSLLNAYLAEPRLQGRFASGNSIALLPVTSGFWRWTLEQQRLYSELLERVTRDPERDQPALAAVIATLARFPALPPRRLVELASLSEPRPAVRDTAIRALARLDSDQAVEHLVDALSDERARIAIYSLRSRLLRMAPDAALDVLRRTPTERVTVAKEVLRLLGDLPRAAGLGELLRRAEHKLHRDVRIALLRALWPHLEEARVWPILEAAAADPDEAVCVGLADIPGVGLSEEAHQRWIQLMARLLGHSSQRVRSATLGRLAIHNWHDRDDQLKTALSELVLNEHGTLFVQAARAWTHSGAHECGRVITGLLPKRKELAALCEEVLRLCNSQPQRWGRLNRCMQEVLQGDPMCLTLRLRLAASEGVAAFTAAVESALATDPRGMATVLSATEALRNLRQGHQPQSYASLAARWAGNEDGLLRRLALESLLWFARRVGWSAELRAQLETFRADPDPLVAAPAQFTFPP